VIICLVTDRRRLGFDLLEQVKSAVEATVDLIQLREHDLEAGALVDLAGEIVQATKGSHTRVVINDRLDVALASGAHGVHLRQSSFPAEAARKMAPPGFLIGCSIHNDRELAAASGADYLIAGTVFETPSKPGSNQYLGIDGLKHLTDATHIPVLAIGGITLERVAAIASAGACGIAAIGLFCQSLPLEPLVDELRRRFRANVSSKAEPRS
jgi:thiamine-phosphate diphosphorylase